MMRQAEQQAAERNMAVAREWFTEGWTCHVDMPKASSARPYGPTALRSASPGPYGGVAATGQRAEVRDTAVWRFEDGKVTEIRTMQDQFAFLQQVGFLPVTVYPA